VPAEERQHGIGILADLARARSELLADKVRRAIDLVAVHGPHYLAQLQRHCPMLTVMPGRWLNQRVRFHRRGQNCVLQQDWLWRESTEGVATALVGVAVYARLLAAGLGRRRFRHRVSERVTREALEFAETLPWGEPTAAAWRSRLEQLEATRRQV
jgi:hypothetical protein